MKSITHYLNSVNDTWLKCLTLLTMSVSLSLPSQAAESRATSMAISTGTFSGSVGNLALALEGKIVNLYTNGRGNLTATFKFSASGLASTIDMSAYVKQKTGADRLKFQALNTSNVWINLGETKDGTSYQRVNLPMTTSNVNIGGVITVRAISNPEANDFVLDQMILTDQSSSPPPPISAPSISSFTTSKSSITAGENVTLSFSASNATSLIINPGNFNVTNQTSLQVSPAANTTYTLTASNSASSVSKSVSILVSAIVTPPPTTKTIPAGTKWYWQLMGNIDTNVNVSVYDIDVYDTDIATISSLKQLGRTVICYYSAGTYENWRSDASAFPASAIGKNVDGWAGEKWIDIRNAQVREVMKARMDLAKSKGCDGLEPDNVDGYTQNSGFTLTKADQINYNRFLATEAHKRGLIVALKNAPDLVPDLVNDFDFSVAEECFRYNECAAYTPFISQNKAVLSAEYTSYSATTCTKAANLKLSTVFYNLNLDGSVFKPCP